MSLKDHVVGLLCVDCNDLSKGGRRGIWRFGRISFLESFMQFFFIAVGEPLRVLRRTDTANKNTWTASIKTVGLVCGEANERERRDPAFKYAHAQVDETAFGNINAAHDLGNLEPSGP